MGMGRRQWGSIAGTGEGGIITVGWCCMDNGIRMIVAGQYHCEGGVGTEARRCTDSSMDMAASGLSCSHVFKISHLFMFCMSDGCDMFLIISKNQI